MLHVTARPGEARPEWETPVPAGWERRLRDISPIVDKTSHLRFRWREATSEWWLYQCVPALLLDPERVEQLSVHWSTLPKEQQAGRRRMCSEYQFWMFRTYRVEATPFWVLQGTQYLTGGTPFKYTERERRILEAQNLDAEPLPPGTFPNVPFDERVVQAILARDKLLKVGNDLDALEKSERPAALRAEDEETEREHRKAFLKWHAEQNAPSAEFMAWYCKQKESEHTLRRAPDGLADTLADWKDRFIATGIAGDGHVGSRVLQVSVL